MNQVYVCGTYFHVYVSILKTIYRKEKDTKSLIIINDLTPGIDKIFARLTENTFFDYLLQVPFKKIERKIKKENNLFFRIIKRNKHIVEFVETDSEILKYDEFIRNSEINIFPDLGLTPSYFLLKYKKNYIRMVEEGEGAYFLRVGKLKAFKRKYILNSFIGGGLDNEVREIEVQLPEKLNKRLGKKGKRFELKKMEDNLSIENREKILEIFMSGIEMDLSGQKKLLLITQPLEETFMSEENKIKLYNQILEKYSDYSIYIKLHPREVTEYKGRLNYNFTIIPGGFPLEMFDLLKGINFELGITVCSSALYNMNCVEKKIILGREYLKKPLPPNWQDLY